MTRTLDFLKKAGTFYLATEEGDQARVRPFGAVCVYDGKLYICTNNKKSCFRQMQANPKVEISAMVGGDWIRLTGTVCLDESRGAREAMLAATPSLQGMYAADDKIFEVLYFVRATASFNAFGKKPEIEEF